MLLAGGVRRAVPPLVARCRTRVLHRGFAGATTDDWSELLERRRRERLDKGSQRDAAPSTNARPGTSGVSGSHGPDVGNESQSSKDAGEAARGAAEAEQEEVMREEVSQRARQMELFAYPTSRTFPWTTTLLLVVSGGLTAAVACLWQLYVCKAESLDDLRPRVQHFMRVLGSCSINTEDLGNGELHRLLLASLLRAGEKPARAMADMVLLVCCGTLLERMHGPRAVVALVVASTLATNAAALAIHEKTLRGSSDTFGVCAPSLASTSGAVVTLGALCTLQYGRWAAWPGVPIPVSWLLAPMLVADLAAANSYFGELHAYREGLAQHHAASTQPGTDVTAMPATSNTALPDAAGGLPAAHTVAVAMAACEAAEQNARRACRPLPEDIAAWREELETVADAVPPPAPDGAFWADVAGFAFAGLAAVVLRRPRGM